jgi:simple sugar transport system substrate-binding protein
MNRFGRSAATVSLAALTAFAAPAAMAAKIFVIGGKPDDPFWSIVKAAQKTPASSPRRRAAP